MLFFVRNLIATKFCRGVRLRFPLEEVENVSYFHLLVTSNKVKRVCKIQQKVENTSVLMGTKCLDTKFSTCSATSGIKKTFVLM